LEMDRPFVAFASYVRRHRDLHAAWKAQLQQHVVSVITQWLELNNLAVDIYQVTRDAAKAGNAIFHQAASAGRSGSPRTVAVERHGQFSGGKFRSALGQEAAEAEETLRHRILAAVACMPLSELLRLPIPAEYLLRS